MYDYGNEISLVGPRPQVIRPCLEAIFNDFERVGVKWAVMRGWEFLPNWTRYDVDILVSTTDAALAVQVVKDSAVVSGWTVYGVLQLGLMHSIWMLINDVKGQSYLRVDIETGNSFRGIEIHESQKYLENRVRENGLWRMPDGYAGACVLLKELAVNGCVDSERRIAQVANGVRDIQFEEILKNALHDDKLAFDLIAAVKASDWESVGRMGRAVKKRLFRITPMRCVAMVKYAAEILRLIYSPYMRLFIVLIGPDGCGKTTVANAIESRFKRRPFQGVKRIHMLWGVPRMRIFKEMAYKLVGKTLPPVKKEAPGDRHCGMKPPHSRLRAMMYVTYYGFGMILGRIKLMLWRPQGGLVLADRFFQDYYYMRGYMNCPKWYVRLFELLAPMPDMIISLERPADDIYAQKPELDVSEIMREQAAIRKYIGGRKNAKIIDASHGIDETIAKVIRDIENHIAARKEF